VLLLSVQIRCNLAETEILEIEWIALLMTAECTITYESYDNTRGQLSGEQFFVANIPGILWHGERLAHHTPYEVELCADELVVGGGVGWSYDWRRRRAAHFSSAAAWLYGRRRRRQTG